MATPLSLEAQHLLKQLAHGEWRRKEDIVIALAPAIAPGRALRRFDATAMSPQERKNVAPSDDEKIRMGQRRLAQIVVRSLRRRFLEAERREDGHEWLRLLSEPRHLTKSKVFRVVDAEPDDVLNQCDLCGGYVLSSQQEDHENFHVINEAPAEDPAAPQTAVGTSGDPAGCSEAQIRGAVREELSKVLDGDDLRRAIGQEMSLVLGGRQARQLIREEVTSVVEQALDDFQAGLQRFLNTWMDDVEKAIFTAKVTRTKLLGGVSRT